ncbi:MAG: HAMP domain-containing sensor histidine kinase [Ilumatobacteraceae bacterium]
MRRRLVLSTIAVVTVVIVVLLVPVLLIVRNAAETELQSRLDQQLASVTTALADDLVAGRPPDLRIVESLLAAGDEIRIVSASGDVIAERGADAISSPMSSSVTGPADTTIELVTSTDELDQRFRDQFLRLALIAVVAIVAAALLAVIQARQLAMPLERLARSASRLGDGDFSVSGPSASGIEEIDSISRAIRLSASRVDRMLESERAFTADATHQLRTGLTGIAMRLELLERSEDPDVAVEAADALAQVHELNSTLDELLTVARRGSTGERAEVDLTALVDNQVADWQPRFAAKRRQVVVTTGNVNAVVATPGLVGQVLGILLDNALSHGRGTVAILVQDESVTIEDEGAGIRADRAATLFDRPTDHHAAHGRGLPLARRLAESDGGRLELAELTPPTFRLTLLPAQRGQTPGVTWRQPPSARGQTPGVTAPAERASSPDSPPVMPGV